jgi:tRNA nucleotidyltransferase (CCA-adding enzyme)
MLKTSDAKSFPRFVLTDQEKAIFKTLLDVNSFYKLGTTFRVAGGWVRDRLLGTVSDDLDIALDNLTGRQLEAYLLKYAKQYPDSGIGKSYTVGVNVEKSKHLETVAVEIHGRKIDFVNLRSESYGETRVPTMEMGDPKTDAERRDLTLNALFYNVNTNEIEDLVGGLEDLETMTLRTPLNPTKTFLDDPLRILRVLRFYSKYPAAKIDTNIVRAISDPKVHEAYRNKVSPERAGPEILKLMSGSKPAEALRVLFETGMDKAAFNIPEVQNLKDLRMDQQNKHHAHNLLEHTLQVVKNLDSLLRQEKVPNETRRNMLLAALFHDYGKAHPEIAKPHPSDPGQMQYLGHEDKSVEIAESILKSIGVPLDDRNFINKVISLHMRPHTESWSNKAIGRFIRETEIPGQESNDIWRLVMLHGMADAMSGGAKDPTDEIALKRQHMEQMREFLNRPASSIRKPLLDGNELMRLFPTLKPNSVVEGRNFIKDINERLLDEQASGNISTKDDALKLVETMRPSLESKYGKPNVVSWIQSNCKFAQPQMNVQYLHVDEEDPQVDVDEMYRCAKMSGINILSDKSPFMVAIVNDMIVGAAFISVLKDEFSFDVAVLPDFQKMRIGSKLTDEVLKEYNNLVNEGMKIKMKADVVNPQMIQMLKSRGLSVSEEMGGHAIMR